MDELKLTKLEELLIEKLEKIDWKFKYEELYPYGNGKGLYINPFGILYYYNINGTPSRLWERLSNEKIQQWARNKIDRENKKIKQLVEKEQELKVLNKLVDEALTKGETNE